MKMNTKELELKLQNNQILTTEEINFLWKSKSGWEDEEKQETLPKGEPKTNKIPIKTK